MPVWGLNMNIFEECDWSSGAALNVQHLRYTEENDTFRRNVDLEF